MTNTDLRSLSKLLGLRLFTYAIGGIHVLWENRTAKLIK